MSIDEKFAIVAQGLGKQYTIGGAEPNYDSFRDMLTGWLKSPFQKYKTLKGQGQDNKFWALQDLNFAVEPGQIVGVIGHNGAGKSTLLKVVTRITAPTVGSVTIRGRVASLLEIGTGFHPELTGRENIYLNGSILGMKRAEIRKKFDEIVQFAEIEQFLDTPVKRYSSGMYVRLAFAVAANLDADVLLVDEVLAVGDQKFQNKCLGKLGEVSGQGRTVLFVSHNLSMVSKLCDKTLFLEKGKVKLFADTQQAIAEYTSSRLDADNGELPGFTGSLEGTIAIKSILINGENTHEITISPSDKIRVVLGFKCNRQLEKARVTISFVKDGVIVLSQHDTHTPNTLETGDYEVDFSLDEKLLAPGRYSISLGISDQETGTWIWGLEQRIFQISEEWSVDYQPEESMGMVNIQSLAQRRRL
ncbi:MAG: polysaccharide ABC transporter ATP-binding protein [Arenicella sp.]